MAKVRCFKEIDDGELAGDASVSQKSFQLESSKQEKPKEDSLKVRVNNVAASLDQGGLTLVGRVLHSLARGVVISEVIVRGGNGQAQCTVHMDHRSRHVICLCVC